jgi:hypothetical protein
MEFIVMYVKLPNMGVPKDVCNVIATWYDTLIKDEAIHPNHNIFGDKVKFNETFDEYSIREKNRFLRIFERKYTDWDAMISRKYEIMCNSFRESGESKLYYSASNLSFELKHPDRIPGGLRFVIIMGADGKRRTRYHQSIGKFTIPI